MGVPHFLRAGFRPFFFGGALWAIFVVLVWIMVLSSGAGFPSAFDPLAWHRHEMLFGYLGAVVAGFLLTAIPNWTGRAPLSGGWLAALACLWLAGRLAILFSASVGALIAFLLDVGFLAALALIAGREITAAGNRNFPIVIVVSLFAVASALDHAEMAGTAPPIGLGWRVGFAIVLVLVGLIGGRIVPSFTRNWLAKRGEETKLPSPPSRFDSATMGATVFALAWWATLPDLPFTGMLLLIAGLLQILRLARWSGLRTMREPLVWILHLSYAWLPLGLLLLGASLLNWGVPVTASVHALGAGAMASMTLAVMTRATLGHTGRPLTADTWTSAIYLLVNAGALVRVTAVFLPMEYMRAIELSGALWGSAFAVFVLAYGPKLLGPRPDAKA